MRKVFKNNMKLLLHMSLIILFFILSSRASHITSPDSAGLPQSFRSDLITQLKAQDAFFYLNPNMTGKNYACACGIIVNPGAYGAHVEQCKSWYDFVLFKFIAFHSSKVPGTICPLKLHDFSSK